MRKVLRSLRLILALIGCLHLCGGHYGVMQMFAWGKMIVEYSTEKGLVDGLADTFDGEHPCEMCTSIAKAKKDQSESNDMPSSSDFRKLELKNLLPTEFPVAGEPRAQEFMPPLHAAPESCIPSFRASPETPPPRIV